MIDLLKWVLLVLGTISVAGMSVFLAAVLALNRRIDRDQERARAASSSTIAEIVPMHPRTSEGTPDAPFAQEPHEPHHVSKGREKTSARR